VHSPRITQLRHRGPARGLLAALRAPKDSDARWLVLLVGTRLAAMGVAAALIVWGGPSDVDALLLGYWVIFTLLLAWVPALRRAPLAWTVDFVAALAFVLNSGDWRSPYYLMWLTTLALPAVALSFGGAVIIAAGAALAFLGVAILGGPVPGRLVSSETLAIHVALPFLLVCALGYAADCLRRLVAERAERERLAVEAERRRIAWELHDSAKQRLHAARLLVSSLQDRVPEALRRPISRAEIELESAAADMDTSLAELRSPLEGRPLDVALRARVRELAAEGGPVITVRGRAPELAPMVAAHAYRIACEAITNALRHADATRIEASLDARRGGLVLQVRDDGRGMAITDGAGTGIFAMTSRAASIGGRLTVAGAEQGTGTVVTLDIPTQNGAAP
jgi:signal transduction histidine kinase